jgi:hypothetical protein
VRSGSWHSGTAVAAWRSLVSPPLVPTLLALVLLTALVAAGCSVDLGGDSGGDLGHVNGSGTPATKTYDYTGFAGLSVNSAFDVTVTRGDAFAVSVTVDDNLVKHLRVELDGDTLRIGLEPHWSFSDTTLKAEVTMPTLTAVEADGSSSVQASGFASGDALDLRVSGASSVTLKGARAGDVSVDVSGAGRISGDLEAQEIGGEASGAGDLALTGTATALKLEASGAGKLELRGLTAQDADLSLSGGADAAVRVTGTLNVDASGGASLDYYGSPTLGKMDVSGGAQVNHAGS